MASFGPQFSHPILASVPSPKSLELRRRSVGCFSRRERSAAIWIITVERATQKNSQLAAARRVALKMGRLLRCSSVTSSTSLTFSIDIGLLYQPLLPHASQTTHFE